MDTQAPENVNVQDLSPHLQELFRTPAINQNEPPAPPVIPTDTPAAPPAEPVVEPPPVTDTPPATPATPPAAPAPPVDQGLNIWDEDKIPAPPVANVEREAMRQEILQELAPQLKQLEKLSVNPIMSAILELSEFDDQSLAKIALPQVDRSTMTTEQLIAEEMRMDYPGITQGEIDAKVRLFQKEMDSSYDTDDEKNHYRNLRSRQILARFPKQAGFAESLDKLVEDSRARRADEAKFWTTVTSDLNTFANTMVGQKVEGVEITRDMVTKVLNRINDRNRYFVTDDKGNVTGYRSDLAFIDTLKVVAGKDFIEHHKKQGKVEITQELGKGSPTMTPSSPTVPNEDPAYLKEIENAKLVYNGRPADLESAIADIKKKYNKATV